MNAGAGRSSTSFSDEQEDHANRSYRCHRHYRQPNRHKTETNADAAPPIVVRVPAELPVLTQQVSRALLALIIELTNIEVIDEPRGEGRSHDD
jgi:hypothetical protein